MCKPDPMSRKMETKDKKHLTDKEIFELLEEYSAILKKYKVKRIGLFGSYIKGEQRGDSDIDFLVEFDLSAFGKNFKGYFDCYIELLFFLEEIFDKKVELLTIEEISPYIRPYVLEEVKYLERT